MRPDADVAVVSNPEFLREGAAIEDFKRPDRVVVGTEDERAQAVMRELYRPLYLNETPILFTSRRTSELIKYAANAFLALKITYINEMADLCEAVGADVQQVARGIGLDGRIGNKFLNAGPGYGGSCFPKDTLALVRTARDAGAPAGPGRDHGEGQRRAQAGHGAQGGQGAGRRPEGQDRRRAGPDLQAQHRRHARRARRWRSSRPCRTRAPSVQAFDPEGHEARELLTGVDFKDDPYDAAEGADVLVIITEWDQFRALDLDRIKLLMNGPGAGRPAQYLQARRHARARLRLHQRGPGGGLTARWRPGLEADSRRR